MLGIWKWLTVIYTEVYALYYSSGTYEAFAKPRKPEGVDEKSAYLVGSGLASLAAACFLVRDGQMKKRLY